jgi:hypothetical protein
MADDPNNTKAAFDKNYVSATEVGEHVTQSYSGAWILAPVVIQEAFLGGCPAELELDQGGQKIYVVPPSEFWFPPDRLCWVNALNPSMRREDFPDRPWPWELRAYLPPSEPWEFRDSEGLPLPRPQVTTLPVFLPRADAIQWGLLPALESPQAMASEESPSPDGQLNDSAIGTQASVHTQSASEQPEATLPSLDEPRAKLVGLIAARATKLAQPPRLPKGERAAETETTRGQREPAIAVAKRLFPPHGRRPKGNSIAKLTKRFNNEPEFKEKNVSEDTVDRAFKDIAAALQK